MATAKFSEKMKEKSHEDMVQNLLEVVKAERRLEKGNYDLQRRLQQKTDEVERLKTMLEAQEAREQSYVKEIEYLTSKPLLCTVNTDSGQDVASVADKQVSGQYQKLQGRVRKRWLDDAMRIKN